MEFWNSFELEVITQAKEQAHTLIAKELSKITSALDAITVQNASLQEKLAKALILLKGTSIIQSLNAVSYYKVGQDDFTPSNDA